jgi:hypothetical protein
MRLLLLGNEAIAYGALSGGYGLPRHAVYTDPGDSGGV